MPSLRNKETQKTSQLRIVLSVLSSSSNCSRCCCAETLAQFQKQKPTLRRNNAPPDSKLNSQTLWFPVGKERKNAYRPFPKGVTGEVDGKYAVLVLPGLEISTVMVWFLFDGIMLDCTIQGNFKLVFNSIVDDYMNCWDCRIRINQENVLI